MKKQGMSLSKAVFTLGLMVGASLALAAPQPVAAQQTVKAGGSAASGMTTQIRLHIARSQGHTVTRLQDGRLLVLGGKSDNLATAAAELIDPFTGKVEFLSSMVQARQGHSATLLPDGRVLVAGGDLGDGRVLAMSSAEVFDPLTQTFRALATPMTLERSHHTATLLRNGQVLITGGQGIRPGMVTFTAELFDPVRNSFESLAPHRLLAPRTYHAATLLESGQVLIVGGTDWQTMRAPTSAELYDPLSKRFTLLESGLSFRNEMPQALGLGTGQVMVLNSQGADLFDPFSQTFIPIGGPVKARSYEAACALSDGGAVVLGGLSANALTASVERYDPWYASFMPAGTLRKPRAWGVATLSSAGSVYVVGGVDSTDAAIAEVEVYWP